MFAVEIYEKLLRFFVNKVKGMLCPVVNLGGGEGCSSTGLNNKSSDSSAGHQIVCVGFCVVYTKKGMQ